MKYSATYKIRVTIHATNKDEACKNAWTVLHECIRPKLGSMYDVDLIDTKSDTYAKD